MPQRSVCLGIVWSTVLCVVVSFVFCHAKILAQENTKQIFDEPQPDRVLIVERDKTKFEIEIFENPTAIEEQKAKFNRLVSRTEQAVLQNIEDGKSRVGLYAWDMLRRERPGSLTEKFDQLFAGEGAEFEEQLRAFDHFAAYDPEQAIQWAIDMMEPSIPSERRFAILAKLQELNGWLYFGTLGIDLKIPWSENLWKTLVETHSQEHVRKNTYSRPVYAPRLLNQLDCPEMRTALREHLEDTDELRNYGTFLDWACSHIAEPWVLDRVRNLLADTPFPTSEPLTQSFTKKADGFNKLVALPGFASGSEGWNALLTLAVCSQDEKIRQEATQMILDAIRSTPRSWLEIGAALRRGLSIPNEELNSYRVKVLELLSLQNTENSEPIPTQLLGVLFRDTNDEAVTKELVFRLLAPEMSIPTGPEFVPNLETMFALELVVRDADRRLPDWENTWLGDMPLATTEVHWRKNELTYGQFLAKFREFGLAAELTEDTVPKLMERQGRETGKLWPRFPPEIAYDRFTGYELMVGTLRELKLCDQFVSEQFLTEDFWKMSYISQGQFLPDQMTMFEAEDGRLDLRFIFDGRLYSVKFSDRFGRPTSTFFPIVNAILEDAGVDWIYCQIEGRPEIAFLASTMPTCLFAPRELVNALEKEFGLQVRVR